MAVIVFRGVVLFMAMVSVIAYPGDGQVTLKGLAEMVSDQQKIVDNLLSSCERTCEETKPIAFYAEMSSDFESKGPGTKLIFDRIFTNVDNAYSDKTGVYKVPKTGMYVFNWRHREFYSQHSVELMVDKDVRGATFKRAQNNDDASVSGTAVLEVKEGDEVYLRFHPELDGQETLVNNLHGRSTFSGWRLR